MKKIETANAPAAIGPYSQAIVIGNLVFTSGQIPINPLCGKIDKTDVSGQTEQVIRNLSAVLQAAGSSLDQVIKTTCFLTNMDYFAKLNKVYASFFAGNPARSCVEVSALPKGALVEIEVVALTDKGESA